MDGKYNAGVHAVDYRETENYQLTRRFLNSPEKMLDLLLQKE
ncbi:MAG: hypothetical protein ACOYJR_09200 [Acutalibacteraceae bacterium]|jgi:predicted ATPase